MDGGGVPRGPWKRFPGGTSLGGRWREAQSVAGAEQRQSLSRAAEWCGAVFQTASIRSVRHPCSDPHALSLLPPCLLAFSPWLPLSSVSCFALRNTLTHPATFTFTFTPPSIHHPSPHPVTRTRRATCPSHGGIFAPSKQNVKHDANASAASPLLAGSGIAPLSCR